MVTNAKTDPIAVDGNGLTYNGSTYLQLPASWYEVTRQPLFAELLNIIHERGVIAGGREMASVLGISSQPKEAAATSGAQAAPHPCSLRPKTPGAIDAYEAAANGAAKKLGTILDVTAPVVSLGQGDSSKNIYAEDLIDPSRKPSTANEEVSRG